MLKYLAPAGAVIAAALALGSPAHAQAGGNTLIIYGNDKCPANAICVRAPEGDRYRIPQTLRGNTLPPEQQPWANRANSVASAGAATGTGSCSATGAGGFTGCWGQMMHQAKQENRAQAAADAAAPVPK